MSPLQVITKTARTISFLVARPGEYFVKNKSVDWQLQDAYGRKILEGRANTTTIFIENLEPETLYSLKTDIGTISETTSSCAGLINAEDYRIDQNSDDNQKAFQAAIDAVPEGGTLLIPPGRFQTSPIFLKPRMTLLLSEMSEIAAVKERTNWPILPAYDSSNRVIGTWEGLPEACFAAFITAIDCAELYITGSGIIDGGGDRSDWWSWPKDTRNGARRPRTLQLYYSNDVEISGITIRNSPSWTVHPYRCRKMVISSIYIENPPDSPNTDGLNPESCEDVTIVGVDFSVGDDCIAIKAGKRSAREFNHLAATHNIKISHCRMRRGHGAIVVGSEMSGGISNIKITNCEFVGTDRGLRLKTRRGRGGFIKDIFMSDVKMNYVGTPLAINAFYFCDPDGNDEWVQSRSSRKLDDTTPMIQNVTLNGVKAQNVSLAAAAVLGLPEAFVKGVKFEDFYVNYDLNAVASVPLMAQGVSPVRHAGILSEFAEVHGTVGDLSLQEENISC